ncbi:4Fe-4S binding protein [Agathobaculum desmolans]|uniref:4Fe-4S binding protein n=1 Tax=Agathobaculum desmolans TaxID=39484 RepID=UPI0005520360|nr:4Fe-4S binding protein [Agathobaculum desmolans]
MQANELISPDKEKCVRCDACVDICPMHVIHVDEDGYPQAVGKAFLTCINCGYCVDVCAPGALRHRVRKRSVNPTAALHAALKRLRAARERDDKTKRGESK